MTNVAILYKKYSFKKTQNNCCWKNNDSIVESLFFNNNYFLQQLFFYHNYFSTTIIFQQQLFFYNNYFLRPIIFLPQLFFKNNYFSRCKKNNDSTIWIMWYIKPVCKRGFHWPRMNSFIQSVCFRKTWFPDFHVEGHVSS